MPAEILNKKEKEKILEPLQERFGIEKLPYLLLKTGREKIRGFSGHLSREELKHLMDAVVVEIIGIYLLKEDKHEAFRLSLDGVHLLSSSLKKNILDISDEQAAHWLKGEDIEVDKELFGFYVIKNNSDFLGCGKASQGRLVNFIPKERRIR